MQFRRTKSGFSTFPPPRRVEAVGASDGVAGVTDLCCCLSDLGGRRLLKQGEHGEAACQSRCSQQRKHRNQSHSQGAQADPFHTLPVQKRDFKIKLT